MTFREKLMLACSGILCTACTIVFLRYGTHQYFIRNLGWNNTWTQKVFADNENLQHWNPPRNIPPDEIYIDWNARYPSPPASPTATEKESHLAQAARKFHEQANSFEFWTNEGFFAYRSIAEFMHAYRQETGWNIPLLSSLKSNDFQAAPDRFASLWPKKNETQQIEATADLAAFCKEHNISFVVFLVPWKISQSSPYNGTLDFTNANSDAYLNGLRERNVNVIDLRTSINEAGLSYDDLFMKTDHHWTLSTARWAISILATHLNDSYGYQADLSRLDASNFRDERYSSWFLGSHGIKLTRTSVRPEDFYLSYPLYPTSFHLSIPSMKIDRQGDFSIFYDMTQMKPASSDTYAYHTYAYGDRALIPLKNKKKQDGKHLLLLHDSYGAAATPFLALSMERLDTIDPRYFTGSLRTYIEREQPDTVVLCYGSIEFNLDDFMHYPRQPFDFR